MIKKIIYIVVWSLGLFWATFPEGFEGGLDFNFSQLSVTKFFRNYMFPLLMVLFLYMVDVIYTFHLESATGGPKNTNIVYFMTAGFLLAFILSVYLGGTIFAPVFFVMAWGCLMAMKYFKTEQRAAPTPLEATAIPED